MKYITPNEKFMLELFLSVKIRFRGKVQASCNTSAEYIFFSIRNSCKVIILKKGKKSVILLSFFKDNFKIYM